MKSAISLIVPMAGEGSRFKAEGFECYKPFLQLAGKSMIEGVIEPFDGLSEIYILTTDAIYKKYSNHFNNLKVKVSVVIIPEHKLGPAYSIHLARNTLPHDRAYAIAYCDVWWSSQNFNVEILQNYKAAIFVHRGFHPHLIADNFSAFCLENKANDGSLFEIREKGSFTDDWMSEPVSIGVFFIGDGNLLFGAIERMIADEGRVAGEFYPSVIFNDLVKSGIEVKLIDVDAYIHIGVPSQFRDVSFWSNFVHQADAKNIPSRSQLNCMLVGGSGTRMKEISEIPKHLLPVNGMTMLEYVLKKFNCSKTVIVGAPNFEFHPKEESNYKVVTLQERTNSHLETFIKSIEYLPDDKGILFTSCDCYGEINWDEFNRLIAIKDAKCCVFSFEQSLLNKKNKQQHTTIKVIDDDVIDVDIKSAFKSYSDGLAGFFWFKNVSVIRELLGDVQLSNIKGELLLDHLILMISKSKQKPVCHKLKSYIHLGTPDEYNEFKYWSGRGSILLGDKRNAFYRT